MSLHDPFDPDLILRAEPFEDVDEIQSQDLPFNSQKLDLRAAATPMDSSKTAFSASTSSAESIESNVSSVDSERGRRVSRPKVGDVQPHRTCQTCERARNAGTARDIRCACDGKEKSSSMKGIY